LDERDDVCGLAESEREEIKALLAELDKAKFKQEAVMFQKARQKFRPSKGTLIQSFFTRPLSGEGQRINCTGYM